MRTAATRSFSRDLLEQVAGRAGHDRVEESFVVAEGGQHEATRSGSLRAHLPTDLHTVAVGEADVEDGDVGPDRADAADGLLRAVGLTDDLDVVLGLEEVAQSTADDVVVVHQEHADRHRAILAGAGGRRQRTRVARTVGTLVPPVPDLRPETPSGPVPTVRRTRGANREPPERRGPMTITETRPAENTTVAPADEPITITRRRIDAIALIAGVAAVLVLAAAGALLTWGSNFAEDYVGDELAAQAITFPPAESLQEEGRDDLVAFADGQVDTGEEAEAYASFIAGHIEGIAEGATYAELGDAERVAEEAATEAITSGAPANEVATLEEEAAAITGQRDSIFRGEMLRGTLLNAFAWSTMGRIAGIAATVAFAAAALMAVLVGLGFVHLRKMTAAQ